ncbi:MAG: HTH-type transcriptional regulator IscR [Acidimicrobiales bacterium]|nr:HTH-type transcriptional regulator IscR [Acidimicrobiales bacterium]
MSEGVEWAIHCCTVLATLPPQSTLPAAKLAELHGVAGPYLAKHLQALSGAEILEAVPGPRGGYRLARPAPDITLYEIVAAVDGSDRSFRCDEIRRQGPAGVADPSAYRTPCTIAQAMWRAEDAWRRELEAVSVGDIVAGLAGAVDPRQATASLVWIRNALR